jgi:hypothetical protein
MSGVLAMLLAGAGLVLVPLVMAGRALGAPSGGPPSLPAGCTQAQVGSMVVCSFASTRALWAVVGRSGDVRMAAGMGRYCTGNT